MQLSNVDDLQVFSLDGIKNSLYSVIEICVREQMWLYKQGKGALFYGQKTKNLLFFFNLQAPN